MSANATEPNHTEHALLVLLGQYAQHLGLIQALLAVPLHQKTYIHRPQTKILEFLVAILAGLPHLEDISRDGRPLDQDQSVAIAWQQASWADYSGVGRTLQTLTQAEAEAIGQVLREISQPLIDQQVTQALAEQGRLIYDGDLTGRPVSSTSTTYPDAAFGHMDDAVRLGYQAAVVSIGSPTYGRHWLAVKPHPGNLVSCRLAEELVLAAEASTGVRPRRRTELLRQRWQAVCEQRRAAEQRLAQRQADLAAAQAELQVRTERREAAQTTLATLVADYQAQQRPERPYSQLAHARQQVETRQGQHARQTQVVAHLVKQVAHDQDALALVQAQESRLHDRLQRFEDENATNPAPVAAVFRLDAGFGTGDNVALLIEMGYEVYTRPHNHQVRDSLLERVDDATAWTRVGANADMVAWPTQSLKSCAHPVDLALQRFHTGQTQRHGVLLHFGDDPVTADLAAWFDFYNGRQTIEAGIKEGKGVFQMQHLKVRSAPALWLQEQFAAFAANFVRWAAHWLSTQCYQEPDQWLEPVAASVKTLVQVAAHTPADVAWLPDGCLLRFTAESLYAGRMIQTGGCAFQLSLPLFQSCSLEPFSTNATLIAQPLR
ncbi:MAG TPA: hypothetical protein VL334_06300 [Anaerolineae bacterium]|nr:hypothetical protein [Anaerolineae bacterium]